MHPSTSHCTGTLSGRGWRARLAPLVLALVLAFPPGCAGPLEKVDCDERLSRQEWDAVLANCPNPFHVASAYLGMAGLNLFNLIGSTAPAGDVTGLLGLTAENINEKRGYINQAVLAVAVPDGGSQAFALLVASFLGMAVTMEQYLDNGTGATGLDGVIAQSEIDAALGVTVAVPNFLVAPQIPPYYLSVVSGTTPYTIHCATGGCDNLTPPEFVYDDADGGGILNTAAPPASSSASEAAVFADAIAGTLASSAYPVQITALTLPLSISPTALASVQSFTGAGNPAGPYEIGMVGYLDYMAVASAELSAASGSTGGTDIAAQISALTTRLDNGVSCTATNLTLAGIVAPLNEFYALYQAAAGTAGNPFSGLPATFPYLNQNLLDPTAVPMFLNPILTVLAPLPTPTYAVPRYKLLFPTVSGLLLFNAAQATPRVDQAEAAFKAEFENIPVFAPSASAAGDGRIDLLELLCAAG